MDWIDQYVEFTKASGAPAIFRLWTAISCVACALERRVFTTTNLGAVYPNLYILLVSRPGIGKGQAMGPMRKFLQATKKISIAPDSVTRASLIDSLEKADGKRISPQGELIEYHALSVISRELGVFMSVYDSEFLSVLTDIYDNNGIQSEGRRTTKSTEIVNPMLNFMAGSQPGFLSTFLPDVAWQQGFMSRVTMVYADSAPKVSLFDSIERPDPAIEPNMIKQIAAMSEMLGIMGFTEDAQRAVQAWENAGRPPMPEHSKLANYCTRRLIHLIKLMMISAISRTGGFVIEHIDFLRALDWLTQVERYMPDIFREMRGKSDLDTIEEAHTYLWSIYRRDNQSVHESRLVQFLQTRVPGERVMRIVELMLKSHTLKYDAAREGYYVPQAKTDWGLE